MARTTLTKTNASGSYPTLPITPGALLVTETAADVANKNQFKCSERDLVLAHNTGATPHTVTVTSKADAHNRTGDIPAYSIPAGEIHQLGPFKSSGWKQTDGFIYLEANHAEIKFSVIQLPQ